jgi:hypothetical protein
MRVNKATNDELTRLDRVVVCADPGMHAIEMAVADDEDNIFCP